MADVENNNGHQHGDRSVEVRVSAQLENLAVVRTVVAALIVTPAAVYAAAFLILAPMM